MSIEVRRERLTATLATVDWASLLPPATVAVLLVTCVLRLVTGAHEPFWLDEVFTGLHAGRTTLDGFLHGIYRDINAPLYAVVTWLWAQAFGLSNASLRLPSTLFGLAVPLLALIPSREIDRTTRLIWCGLLATWAPGIGQSQEARCYTMLLALSTGGVILYARLLARPTLGRAAAWAAVGALAILTHYYAALLFGCQGLLYLALHRGRALRTWPAALAFVPAFGWMAYHLPQLAGFVEVNWYATLSLAALPFIFDYALGPSLAVIGVAALGLPHLGLGRADRSTGSVLRPVVAAGAAGCLILVVAGYLRPSFTLRYLTIFVPSLLLGAALWARAIAERRPYAPVALALASTLLALNWCLSFAGWQPRIMNWETASGALMADGARRLAFTWDSPITAAMTADEMADLGAFFFRRAGYPIEATGIVLRPGDDPNARLAAAADKPGDASIWVYDLGVGGTAAGAHPPVAVQDDPARTCRNHGRGAIGIVACLRAPELGLRPGLMR